MRKKLSLGLLLFLMCLIVNSSIGNDITAQAIESDDSPYSDYFDELTDNTYEIDSANDLVVFAMLWNEGVISGNVKVEITQNIDVSDAIVDDIVNDDFEGIGTDEHAFQGEFKGNKCTITLDGAPLFGAIQGKTNGNQTIISDIKIDGSVTATSGDIGALARSANNCSISNCHNYAVVENTGDGNVGGILGSASYLAITYSENSGAVIANGTSTGYGVGGIIGYSDMDSDSGVSTVSIKNCVNEGTITSQGSALGGIVGYSESAILTTCENTGIVEQYGTAATGGIVGEFVTAQDENVEVHVSQCSNWGTIKNLNKNLDTTYCLEGIVGGIVGVSYGQGIEACFNTGTIEGWIASGIVGKARYTSSNLVWNGITDCYNAGDIVGYYYGAGICNGSYYVIMKDCYNIGTIDTSEAVTVGPIFAWNYMSKYTNCYYIDTDMPNYDQGTIDGEIEGVTAEALVTTSAFVNDSVWIIDDGLYPRLSYYSLTDELETLLTIPVIDENEDDGEVEYETSYQTLIVMNQATGDYSTDLADIATRDSEYDCSFYLEEGTASDFTLEDGVLTISNSKSGSYLEVGSHGFNVYISRDGGETITGVIEVDIEIVAKAFTIYDFTLDGNAITAANLASMEEAVAYDGTFDSIKKEISSDFWVNPTDTEEGAYAIDYAFDTATWTVTLTITPNTALDNMQSDAEALVYTYSVEKRSEVIESLVLNQYYTFPLEVLGGQTVVTKDGETDGCVYEDGISFYVNLEGNYTYASYTGE